MPDWNSIISLLPWLREFFARPKVTIEVTKASWSKLEEGNGGNLQWRETSVKVELRLLNTGVKTTIMDALLNATAGQETFRSLTPKKIKSGFLTMVGRRGTSSSFWYSVEDSKTPLPVLAPHEPVTLELCFLIPSQIATEQITCELQFIDTFKKRWVSTFLAREEPLKY